MSEELKTELIENEDKLQDGGVENNLEEITLEKETLEIEATESIEGNPELEESEEDDFKEIFIENSPPGSIDYFAPKQSESDENDLGDELSDEAVEEKETFETPSHPVSTLMTLKGRIEAVLFLTNLPLQASEIAEKLNVTLDEAELALLELVDDYLYREDSALEIDDTDGYILQVKKDYQSVTEQMLPVEISTAAVRTLSAIALKGPLLQSKLVEIRGSSAYEHIKELSRNGLIAKKRQQQSFILKVTPKFHEYFKIQGSQLSHILAQDEA